MRVLVDLSGFLPRKAYGGQTYIEGLLTGLATQDATVAALVGTQSVVYLRAKFPSIEFHSAYLPNHPALRLAHSSWLFDRLSRKCDPGVVFFPLNIATRTRLPSVVMVHDLVSRYYLREYGWHKFPFHAVRSLMVNRSIRIADSVVCPSRFVQGEILATSGKEAVVIHECSDYPVQRRAALQPLPPVARILVPSYGAPHKQPEVVLEAIRILENREEELNLVELRFTGAAGERGNQLIEHARRIGLKSRIVFTGYLSREQLCQEYASSRATVIASRYEGFGLPILEALACGTAVIASNLEVFREVGGEAATYFDDNPKSLAFALSRALSEDDDPQVASNNLLNRSWHDYASDLLRHLKDVALAN